MRVYEVARDLGVSSREVMRVLSLTGVECRAACSTLPGWEDSPVYYSTVMQACHRDMPSTERSK
jgi:hypothetical protein